MIPTFARLANAARQNAREALKARTIAPAYPVISKCPSPICECADMPPDLDIERNKPLNGTMPAHAEQLLIPSARSDWKSKIEDEIDTAPWGELAANVKKILGKGGEYHDPYHSVSIATCSFEEPQTGTVGRTARALLFPSFKMVDQMSTDRESVLDFVKTFLLPQKLHAQYDSLSEEEKRHKTRDPENANSSQWAGKVMPISAPTVMVCSHQSRDSRCGILGPLLHTEFTAYIGKRNTLRNQALSEDSPDGTSSKEQNDARTFPSHPEFRVDTIDSENGMQPINVGMMSHMGGHAWAGNVIVYIPPDYRCNPLEPTSKGSNPQEISTSPEKTIVSEEDRSDEILESDRSPLAGKTIWYGRVEPKHVEGIVEQTIGHGKIIGELFRGGVNADGSIIRI